MKIAFCNRPNWDNPLGGDGVQMLKTKEALEVINNGIDIKIIDNPKNLDKSFDIVHIFNYVTYGVTEKFVKRAVELNVPIITSSIFWDYTYAYNRFMNFFISDKLSPQAASVIAFMTKVCSKILGRPLFFSSYFKNKVKYFMQKSELILPNSEEEADLLIKFVGDESLREKVRIVYNAADIPQSGQLLQKKDFLLEYQLPDMYILQVGRIEPVKNQINLIYALRNHAHIPIVFLGRVVNNAYYKKLKKVAQKRGNVFFVDSVKYEDVANFYKYASLHVLPSLRESPGLVSLEALSYGCPIVVSDARFVPLKTYFSHQPYVINPLDVIDIEKVVLKAYRERTVVSEDQEFSWEVTAIQTNNAYKELLDDLSAN